MQNIELVKKVEAMAAKHNATAGQMALAWLHAQVQCACAACLRVSFVGAPEQGLV